MTGLDQLLEYILSDKMKEVKNYYCYDDLVRKAKTLKIIQDDKSKLNKTK